LFFVLCEESLWKPERHPRRTKAPSTNNKALRRRRTKHQAQRTKHAPKAHQAQRTKNKALRRRRFMRISRRRRKVGVPGRSLPYYLDSTAPAEKPLNLFSLFDLISSQTSSIFLLMKLLAEITKDCLDLPSAQRLKLARILIEVSEPAGDFSLDTESAWEEEIAARIEAVKNGSARSRQASDLFRELDAKFPS
jgi:hypothetical protein